MYYCNIIEWKYRPFIYPHKARKNSAQTRLFVQFCSLYITWLKVGCKKGPKTILAKKNEFNKKIIILIYLMILRHSLLCQNTRCCKFQPAALILSYLAMKNVVLRPPSRIRPFILCILCSIHSHLAFIYSIKSSCDNCTLEFQLIVTFLPPQIQINQL